MGDNIACFSATKVESEREKQSGEKSGLPVAVFNCKVMRARSLLMWARQQRVFLLQYSSSGMPEVRESPLVIYLFLSLVVKHCNICTAESSAAHWDFNTVVKHFTWIKVQVTTYTWWLISKIPSLSLSGIYNVNCSNRTWRMSSYFYCNSDVSGWISVYHVNMMKASI